MTYEPAPYAIINPADLLTMAVVLSAFWFAALCVGCWMSWRFGFVSGALAQTDGAAPTPGLTIRQDTFGGAV